MLLVGFDPSIIRSLEIIACGMQLTAVTGTVKRSVDQTVNRGQLAVLGQFARHAFHNQICCTFHMIKRQWIRLFSHRFSCHEYPVNYTIFTAWISGKVHGFHDVNIQKMEWFPRNENCQSRIWIRNAWKCLFHDQKWHVFHS